MLTSAKIALSRLVTFLCLIISRSTSIFRACLGGDGGLLLQSDVVCDVVKGVMR